MKSEKEGKNEKEKIVERLRREAKVGGACACGACAWRSCRVIRHSWSLGDRGENPSFCPCCVRWSWRSYDLVLLCRRERRLQESGLGGDGVSVLVGERSVV